MTSWRPVNGSVLRLDPSLASVADIEKFFTDRKIIARGAETGEDVYELELVATGRRKRVATLNDDGEVIPGKSLAELVEELDTELRKLQIDLGGVIAWGDLDLGEVDVAGDDLDTALRASALADEVDREREEELESDELEEDKEPFEYSAGPILVVSDIALADMPGLAAHVKKPLSVLRMGGMSAVMGEAESGNSSGLDLKTSFSLVVSTDAAGLDKPVVSLRRHNWRLTWTFNDVLSPLPWVQENDNAAEFAATYLGAGALAHRVARKIPDVDVEELRSALEGDPDEAPRLLVRALHLPGEVGDFLNGFLSAEAIPEVVVFEPRPLGRRIQTSVAYELVGEGNSRTGMWQAYRKVFVDRPRLTGAVAFVQAGIGTALFAGGLHSWRETRGKIATIVGAVTVINAGTRMLTTQWLQMALRKEGLDAAVEGSFFSHETS